MPDGYIRQRTSFGDLGGGLSVTPFTGTTTLMTPRTGHKLYVQTITVQITNGVPGITWSIQDASGVSLTGPLSAGTSPATFLIDFGADGMGVSDSNILQFVPSATGASGIITWDAFQRPPAVAAA